MALRSLVAGVAPAPPALADESPRSWIDPDTGHRIIQLSQDPNTSCLYFTQYAYCAGGTKLILTTTQEIQLVTISTGKLERLYKGSRFRVVQAGRKTGHIYFTTPGAAFALDPASGQIRHLAQLPPFSVVQSVNRGETTLAGVINDGGDHQPLEPAFPPPPPGGYQPGQVALGNDDFPDKMDMMARRLAKRWPMSLFTLDLATGGVTRLIQTTDWLNHVQFSPTDDRLLSFCHEGPWWLVDRVWLLRAGSPSGEPFLVHRRTMNMEIANHEYWSATGDWIWYDLETPMNEDFWVAGYNVRTGRRVRYHLTLDQWSIHYNQSPDGTLFCGDGGEPGHLGPQPPHSKWLYLFHPVLALGGKGRVRDDRLIDVGTFQTEPLVNLAEHDYSVEPNGNFTPDGKWIVFRSNMRGPIEVYAVEVAKAKG